MDRFSVTPPTMAEIATRAVGLAPFGRLPVSSGIETPPDHGPANYRRPDAFIVDDVAKLLAWDPLVPSTTLEITCSDGVLKVGGTVPDSLVAERVGLVVSTVIGVKRLEVDVSVEEAWLPRPAVVDNVFDNAEPEEKL